MSLLPLCLCMLLLLSAVSAPTPASLFCSLIPVQPKYHLFKEAILICTPIYAFLLRYPSSISSLTPCHLSQRAIHHNRLLVWSRSNLKARIHGFLPLSPKVSFLSGTQKTFDNICWVSAFKPLFKTIPICTICLDSYLLNCSFLYLLPSYFRTSDKTF